jgi:indole-3-glycerol phosphate synthase
MENLLRVRPHVGFPHPSYMLLGINNRNLETQTVDIANTLRMVDLVEQTNVLVSESGIRTSAEINKLRHAGVRIVLVGEHLLRAEDPGAALANLLGRDPR